MIKALSIMNFRGIRDLSLDDLTSVSLIAGENSVGKSTVLEALFLLLNYQAPDVFLKLNSFRGRHTICWPDDMWGYIAPVGSSEPTVISANINDISAEIVLEQDPSSLIYQNAFTTSPRLNYVFRYGSLRESGFFSALPNEIRREVVERDGAQEQPAPRAIYVPALRGGRNELPLLLGNVELLGLNTALVEALQAQDERVSALVSISRPDGPELHVRFRDNTILPLSMAGDGLANICMFVISILSAPGAIVLIDEIENGVHYSKYAALWSALCAATDKNGAQIIAATYSYEFTSEAVDASRDIPRFRPSLYRLDKIDKKTFATHYPPGILAEAVMRDAEVR